MSDNVNLLNLNHSRTLYLGATREEINEYFRLGSLETEERNRLRTIERMSNTPDHERIKYNYQEKLGKKDEDIPDFMKFIFIHPAIPTVEKDKFITFCIRFLSNESYRKQYEGKQLFFRNLVLERIVDNYRDPIIDYSNGDSRLFVPIGELSLSYRLTKNTLQM